MLLNELFSQLDESTYATVYDNPRTGETAYVTKRPNGSYYGYTNKYDFVAADEEELIYKLKSWGFRIDPVGAEKVHEAAGVGVVAGNKKMARDPRYSMSQTVDIGPGETQKQAAKFGNKTDKLGVPPRLRADGKVNEDWKDAAKVGTALGVATGMGMAGQYMDANAPRVQIGNTEAYYVSKPSFRTVPPNAKIVKGNDGRTYKVWQEGGKIRSGSTIVWFATPYDDRVESDGKVNEFYDAEKYDDNGGERNINQKIFQLLKSGAKVYSSAAGRVGEILSASDDGVIVKTKRGKGFTSFNRGDAVKIIPHKNQPGSYVVVNEMNEAAMSTTIQGRHPISAGARGLMAARWKYENIVKDSDGKNADNATAQLAHALTDIDHGLDYDSINDTMYNICEKFHIMPKELHNAFIARYNLTPDRYAAKMRHERKNKPKSV